MGRTKNMQTLLGHHQLWHFFFRQCRPGVLLLNAEKHFLKCTNSRLGRTCTLHVCLLYALQAKSASIDVTKGVGGVSPPNNFIIFFKHINRDKQLLKFCLARRCSLVQSSESEGWCSPSQMLEFNAYFKLWCTYSCYHGYCT